MWQNFDGKPYTKPEFAAHVAGLPAISWCRFITLHNTASPNLAQWEAIGGATPAQRIANLRHYYEDTEHWHAGPHLFIDREHIWGFTDLTVPGVHASCFNHVSIGIEMVGDYATEAFNSEVRDNAVFALARLHAKLGLRPDFYEHGVKGLHFHLDCIADHHACPGTHVERSDIVTRVLAAMQAPPRTTRDPASSEARS